MALLPESPTILHTVLNAAQAGALFALAANFGADAITRRDRLMGWLTLACLCISARHGALVLWGFDTLPYSAALKLQSVLASLGFIALSVALRRIFPTRLSPNMVNWIVVGMVPNFFRNAFLSAASPLDLPLHQLTNFAYAVGCLYAVVVVARAKFEDDPIGQRMFWGLVATLAPVLLEVAAMAFFSVPLRLSGLGLLMLAIAMGASWQWVIASAQTGHTLRAEEEARAWRFLVSGPTWHTAEPSPMMESLFGPEWPRKLEERMVGRDGILYAIHQAELKQQAASCGWIETHLDTLPGTEGILTGWTVALSIVNAETLNTVGRWLQEWGAEVQIWGAVPPREGPYPSVLVWGREPVILSVWREHDLSRRMPRWVQLGGASLEGPHAQLDLPPDHMALQGVLQRLISLKS